MQTTISLCVHIFAAVIKMINSNQVKFCNGSTAYCEMTLGISFHVINILCTQDCLQLSMGMGQDAHTLSLPINFRAIAIKIKPAGHCPHNYSSVLQKAVKICKDSPSFTKST